MPQDTVVYDNINSGFYPGKNSLSPAEKAEVDRIVNHTAWPKQDPAADYQKYSNNDFLALEITIGILVGVWLLIKYFNTNPFNVADDEDFILDEDAAEDSTTMQYISAPQNSCLTYEGYDLDLSEETVTGILIKHFPYYNKLNATDQKRFLQRHKKFTRDKIFKIHDAAGFREMPVLISAAAIQLSFGLQEYMLPFYTYINVFPREFLRVDSGICFLEGNVSGNNIKMSWKHFLQGYALPENGENVGLHEMAHAYYCQNFLCRDDQDDCFIGGFSDFTIAGTKVFEAEQICGSSFYSSYSTRNFQEFWAESVERFFEQPLQMRTVYPDVYAAISKLLNQDPAVLM